MGYSPKKLPSKCENCGFIICKCYTDEIIDNSIEYDPLTTEPEKEITDVQELNFDNDILDWFEFQDAADNWRN